MEFSRSFPSVTFAVLSLSINLCNLSTVLSCVDNRVRIATLLKEMAHFL